MKRIIIALLLLATTYTFAQKTLSKDYDYKVSTPYKVVDARSKEYFSNGKEVLGVKIKANKNQVLLQKYNTEGMKEIGKQVYNDLPKNFIYEGVIQAQDHYYFFYSSWTGRKTKHERLFYREIDFDKGTFKGESKQIIDHDGKLVNFFNYRKIFYGWSAFNNFAGTTKFDLMTSDDESKILVQYRKKPKVRKDTKSWDIINVAVFDISMNNLWKKQYTMPYTERRMDFMDNMIDNEGKIFMVTKVYHDNSNKDKKKRKDKKANYHIELFELSNTLDKIKTSKISLDDKFINGVSMYQSKNKEILIAGFYNKGNTKTKGGHLAVSRKTTSDGLYTYKINENGELADKHFYEIPLEIINQYASKRTKKKNKKKGNVEYQGLQLNQLIFGEDNSITLVGEVDYIVTHYKSAMGGLTKTGQATYTFHYEDILITKINPNGELAWMKKIPKNQKGNKGKGGMSYSYFNANGNHYLIYLDNVKNFNLSIDKRPALHMDGKGGYLTAMKINDETGEAVKGSVLDFRRIKGDIVAYQFNTDRIVKIKENEFFVEVYKKKKEDVFLKTEMKK